MDMRRHGTMQDGERCVTSKLTVEQVAEIRERVRVSPRGTQRKLAPEYEISFGQMSRIVNDKRWKHTL